MTRDEAISRMRRIQEVLDKGMFRSRDQLVTALFAEYGEFLEATKADWAWWKRNDKDFEHDITKARDEAVDMLHFYLGLLNIENGKRTIPSCLPPVIDIIENYFVDWNDAYAEYVTKAWINLSRWGRDIKEIDHLVGEELLADRENND